MASPERRSHRKRQIRSLDLPEPISQKEERLLKLALDKSLVDTTAAVFIPHTLAQAPTLTPSIEEFADPLAYIRANRHLIEPTGIVKIVPPAGWKPAFALDVDHVRFETKRQTINRLGEGLPYDDGLVYDFKAFQKQAEGFRALWESKLRAKGRDPGDALCWEQTYWEIVEGGEDVIVDYGNDVSTDDVGSGFPRPDLNDDVDALNDALDSPAYYTKTAWNLCKIPFAQGSVMRHLHDRINGINVPWLYFGMTFATFSWHTEDNWLYSLNYHHRGHAKTWYGVPAHQVHDFDQAMKAMIPQRFEDEPALMQQLVTMMSPSWLLSRGVIVSRLVQTPGSFVVTLPGAYHAGFSHGFNCGEAVNFASADWLVPGRECRDLYRKNRRPPVIALDKLVWNLANEVEDMLTSDVAILAEQLRALCDEETELRERVARDGVSFTVRMPSEDPNSDEPDIKRRCVYCEQPCSLSTIICACVPDKASCPRHHAALCKCPANRKCLVYWRSVDELEALVANVDAELKTRRQDA